MTGLPILLMKSLRSALNARRVVQQHSSLKVLVILTFGIFLLSGLTVLFYAGFYFLHNLGGMGLMVIHRLFALFFFGLAVMLVFSSLVTSYATLYRSDEIPDLLLRPITHGQVVVYKSLEAALFSSWAFFFMIVPFVAAYAWHQRLPLMFPIWTFLFSVPFVLVCSAVGSLVCLVLVCWLPSGRHVLAVGLMLAVVVILAIVRTLAHGPDTGEDESTLVLSRLIPGLRLASQPLWPSWWVSEGIMALARGDWSRGMLYWGVLMANVLFAGVVVEAVGGRIYYDGWQRGLVSRSRSRARGGATRRLGQLLFLAGRDVRALVVKDMRLFVRDPVQWSQGVVFFSLLAIYFLNLRSLHYDALSPVWRNLIVFLNMLSVSAVICSLSARFIYPQMSLEGHSFWVAGLSPVPMRKILLVKFRLSAVILVIVSLVLMMMTTRMLRVDRLLQGMALLIAIALPLGITGMSVGLGAVFLDLKERNPAAIVSSFGGTLNLVLGMIYALFMVLLVATVFHLHGLGRMTEGRFHMTLFLAGLALGAVTAFVTWYPLRLGCRKLMKGDY